MDLAKKAQKKLSDSLHYIFIFLACLLQVSSHLYSNEIHLNISIYMFTRGAFTIFISLLLSFCKKSKFEYQRVGQIKIFVRSLCLVIYIWFIAKFLFYFPYPVIYTVPCVGIPMYLCIQHLYRSDQISVKYTICLAVAVTGSLIAILSSQMTKKQGSLFCYGQDFGCYATILFLFLSISIAFLWGTNLKFLVQVDLSSEAQCFYSGLVLTLISAISYFNIQEKPSAQLQYLSYLYSGLPAALSEILFTQSILRSQKHTQTLIFFPALILFGYAFSVLRYSQIVNLFTLLGTVFVLAGVYRSIYIKANDQDKISGSHKIQVFPSKYHETVYEIGEWGGGLGLFLPKICCIQYPYKVIERGEVGVYERFGKYHQTVGSGLQYFNVLVDEIHVLDLKTKVMDLEKIRVQTMDNVQVQIDAAAYYNIVDPKKAFYRLNDIQQSVRQISLGGVRSIGGHFSLQELIEKRSEILSRLKQFVSKQTNSWGIDITNILIKNVQINDDLKDVFAAVAAEKRISEMKILNASAQLQTAIFMQETSELLNSKAAMQMRYLQSLQRIARNQNVSLLMLDQSYSDDGERVFIDNLKNNEDDEIPLLGEEQKK